GGGGRAGGGGGAGGKPPAASASRPSVKSVAARLVRSRSAGRSSARRPVRSRPRGRRRQRRRRGLVVAGAAWSASASDPTPNPLSKRRPQGRRSRFSRDVAWGSHGSAVIVGVERCPARPFGAPHTRGPHVGA